MAKNIWDVIVAGGGPAGLSASLMLGRARRRVLVIDAGSPRNRFAAHMHGVLGHEGIDPAELIRRGRAEVQEYGVELMSGHLESVERVDTGVRVRTSAGESLDARALIVATGLTDDLPAIPGLAERWGTSVLHCPYCHGWEVRDQHLGVLTTSPLSMHQAELIRQWSDRVTVFTAGLGPLAPEVEDRLRSRGIALETAPVIEVLGEGTTIRGVRLADGREVAVDAIFTGGTPRTHESFLDELALDRADHPFGSFLAVDSMGRTSDERIWAIGNVVNPGANVPLSIGSGSFAGAAVNAALVTWDFDEAREGNAEVPVAPKDFWEQRYAASDRIWSGRVNRVLADIAATLAPGRALDLGCGEGADAMWLARHGWQTTGIDISTTAIDRATKAAEHAGLDTARVRFLAADLATVPEGAFDLVTASFFHSPVHHPREDILQQALTRVAPGGHLLITSHSGLPSWADASHPHASHHFLSPTEELEHLDLDADTWEVVLAENRVREITSPDGDEATIDDGVVLVRRRVGQHQPSRRI